MRHILLGILCSIVAFFPSFAAASDAKLSLKGDQIFLLKGGKSTALNQEMFPAQTIDDSDMRFLGVGSNDAKEQGIEPGLYIFKREGEPVAFAATEQAEFSADVKLSPNQKILAMDSGTSLVRNWVFFSYPDMKPLGDTLYYQIPDTPTLVWIGEKGALFSTMAVEEHGRSCGYDPCGPVSVSYYDFDTHKSAPLLVGTDLCDYSLTGLQADGLSATATELCLSSAKEWENFPEGKPVKAVTVKLP